MEIKKGDVVTLKSGGPDMSVEEFEWNAISGTFNNNKVDCVWFVDDELRKNTFDISVLKKVKE